MRTKLVLCAALAAFLSACENKQITEVETEGTTIGTTGSTGTPPSNPSTNGIDYTPRGGSGRVGTSIPLAAICGTAVCPGQQPFWYSDHPELIDVLGTEKDAKTGFNVGMAATLRFIAPSGTVKVNICIQPSLSVKNPHTCYEWTSTP